MPVGTCTVCCRHLCRCDTYTDLVQNPCHHEIPKERGPVVTRTPAAAENGALFFAWVMMFLFYQVRRIFLATRSEGGVSEYGKGRPKRGARAIYIARERADLFTH